MTAVCKAAVKGNVLRHVLTNRTIAASSHLLPPTDDNPNCPMDTAIIRRRVPVLLKYLNSDTERQLQALYALQALIVALDQPPSKCRRRFLLLPPTVHIFRRAAGHV